MGNIAAKFGQGDLAEDWEHEELSRGISTSNALSETPKTLPSEESNYY